MTTPRTKAGQAAQTEHRMRSPDRADWDAIASAAIAAAREDDRARVLELVTASLEVAQVFDAWHPDFMQIPTDVHKAFLRLSLARKHFERTPTEWYAQGAPFESKVPSEDERAHCAELAEDHPQGCAAAQGWKRN